MYSLPPTPPQDCEDPLAYSLTKPIADLSLGFAWTTSPSISSGPPSYDPTSPSYDPSAASPCNPFPTSSPFSTFTFTRAQAPAPARSKLRFEDTSDSDVTSEQSMQPSTAFSQIPPPHSAPSLRRTKPCRFYLSPAGCKTGRWCNFKHPVGAGVDGEGSSLDALRAAVVRSRKGHVDACPDPDPGMWDDVPDVRDLDPDWGKKSDDDVHPKWRTQPCRNFLLGLCRYGPKCQFIHAPGLYAPALPMAGGTHVLVPPAYPKSLPLPVPVPVNVPSSLPSLPTNVASQPVPVPVSVWGAHPGVGAGSPAMSEKPEQMSLYYRTKPCKYFGNDGTCPHGAECKFIHDPKKASPTTSSPSAPPPPTRGMSWADDDRELDFEEAPQFVEDEMDVDAAMHDVTNAKVNTSSRKRRDRAKSKEVKDKGEPGGIYKPLWRVVGGGVMIGKREERKARESRSRMHKEDEDEDAVLEYQPRDSEPSASAAYAQPSLADDSPLEYHAPFTAESLLDYDYTYDPSLYPPHELLRSPSPTGPLEIAMGRFQESMATAPARKKRIVTGAELMAGIRGAGTGAEMCEVGRARSEEKEREREKPRLTIAVPAPASFTHSHRRTQSYRGHGVKGPAGYTPYPYPTRRIAVAARTEVGDDVLDWGDADDEDAGETDMEGVGEEIRRVRSTPPTPRSNASYLDVPFMPRLPAESP